MIALQSEFFLYLLSALISNIGAMTMIIIQEYVKFVLQKMR